MPLNKPPAEIFKNSDLPAFVTDAVVYLKAHMPKSQDAASLFAPSGRAQNVRIDGDSALATVGKKDMKFARVNQKWFARATD
jgi:hypothetical protein